MANEKISQLPAGSPAQSTDQIPIARSGANFFLTVAQIIGSALGAVNFSALTTGTNTTATMTVGSGAILEASGSGEILATNVQPSFNAPHKVALGSPVSLPANTQTTVLSISVTFPAAAGTYRADIRYGAWAEVGPNAVAAQVIDTTNTLPFAISGQDGNGSGFIALSASEVSSNTYAAGATVTFTLVLITNAAGGGTAEVTSGLFTLTPAEATFLSITPVLSN
jgi:hypothetical protein